MVDLGTAILPEEDFGVYQTALTPFL